MNTAVSALLQERKEDVVSTGSTTTAYDAIQLMSDKGVGAVLILNKSGGLAGILSERDCFKKVILAEKNPKDTSVREIMTRKVVVVPPERTVEECMALMTEKHIRHLPVVDGDKILGMISMRDVVRYLADDRDLMIKNLEKYIEGSY